MGKHKGKKKTAGRVKCDYNDRCRREAKKKGRFSNYCIKHLAWYARNNPGIKIENIMDTHLPRGHRR